MIGLSKRTDYGLLALVYLAAAPVGRVVRTRDIAEQHDLPVELLAKILQRLAKSGMIASTPGPTGGYHLARSTDDISIGQVVAAIEGAPALIHCERTDHNRCNQLDKCTIRKPLTRIQARVYDLLNLITLSEITGPEPPDELVFQSQIVRSNTIKPATARDRSVRGEEAIRA